MQYCIITCFESVCRFWGLLIFKTACKHEDFPQIFMCVVYMLFLKSFHGFCWLLTLSVSVSLNIKEYSRTAVDGSRIGSCVCNFQSMEGTVTLFQILTMYSLLIHLSLYYWYGPYQLLYCITACCHCRTVYELV